MIGPLVGPDERRITRRAAIVGGAALVGASLLSAAPARAALNFEPSTASPVAGVSTSTLTVLGVFPGGPVNEPVLVTGWDDFLRRFGGPDPAFPFGARPSVAGAVVYQFFTGGGTHAYVVGLAVSAADDLAGAVLSQVTGPGSPSPLDPIWASTCNLLCIPDLAFLSTTQQAPVIVAAQQFCKAREAFLIVDPPPPSAAMTNAWLSGTNAVAIDDIGTSDGMARLRDWAGGLVNPACDASAAYYPWVQIADPFGDPTPRYIPPSGAIAGLYALADLQAGVWLPAAGMSFPFGAVSGLADPTIDNPVVAALGGLGINALRSFSGAHFAGSEFTIAHAASRPFAYVTTTRLADYIQQSSQQSLRWTEFEPNGPALWSSVTRAVTPFLLHLWQYGALVGADATEAFLVTCDASTTSAADAAAGICNLSITFAPVRPADFLTLTVALRAGPPAAA